MVAAIVTDASTEKTVALPVWSLLITGHDLFKLRFA